VLFRYDFGEKLDTTKFNVQAQHYIGQIHQIDYRLVLPNYKLKIDISTPELQTQHLISVSLYSLTRDEDGEIKNEEIIYPLRDTRFKDFNIIKEIWTTSDTLGGWISNSTAETVNKIIKLLTIVHKINNLRVFL